MNKPLVIIAFLIIHCFFAYSCISQNIYCGPEESTLDRQGKYTILGELHNKLYFIQSLYGKNYLNSIDKDILSLNDPYELGKTSQSTLFDYPILLEGHVLIFNLRNEDSKAMLYQNIYNMEGKFLYDELLIEIEPLTLLLEEDKWNYKRLDYQFNESENGESLVIGYLMRDKKSKELHHGLITIEKNKPKSVEYSFIYSVLINENHNSRKFFDVIITNEKRVISSFGSSYVNFTHPDTKSNLPYECKIVGWKKNEGFFDFSMTNFGINYCDDISLSNKGSNIIMAAAILEKREKKSRIRLGGLVLGNVDFQKKSIELLDSRKFGAEINNDPPKKDQGNAFEIELVDKGEYGGDILIRKIRNEDRVSWAMQLISTPFDRDFNLKDTELIPIHQMAGYKEVNALGSIILVKDSITMVIHNNHQENLNATNMDGIAFSYNILGMNMRTQISKITSRKITRALLFAEQETYSVIPSLTFISNEELIINLRDVKKSKFCRLKF